MTMMTKLPLALPAPRICPLESIKRKRYCKLEEEEASVVHVQWVEVDALQVPLPTMVRVLERVGVAHVQTELPRWWERGDAENGDCEPNYAHAWVFFSEAWEVPVACSIARRLRKATRGNPALLERHEVREALHIIIDASHAILIREIDDTFTAEGAL